MDVGALLGDRGRMAQGSDRDRAPGAQRDRWDSEQGDSGGEDEPGVEQCELHPQRAPGKAEHRSRPAGTGHHASPIRYPPPRSVWMTGGSPSLARSRRIAVLTAVVKGSAASSQTRSSSSSAETTRPAEASRHSRTANSFGLSSRRRPARNATRRLGSRVTSPLSSVGGSAAAERRPRARMRATSSEKSKGFGK